MTVTINDNCESITVDSANLAADNQSVKLSIKVNCDAEYLKDIDVDETEVELIPGDIDLPDATYFPDGVYLFEFTIVDADGVITKERKCVLVNCGLNCMMTDAFKAAATGDADGITQTLAFYALTNAGECADCTCDDMCLLFDATKLKTCNIYATTGCGCSKA